MGIGTFDVTMDRTLVDGLVSITTGSCLPYAWHSGLVFSFGPGGHWLQQHCPVLCFLWHPAGCRVRGLKYVGLGDLTVLICFGPSNCTVCGCNPSRQQS